ncbi:hypothetical protein [Actibacterium sp.]|uniref:hypothetical protein n=1 Tax=Actibacterium sp. TaxID=1872125 RepID=UPI003563B552
MKLVRPIFTLALALMLAMTSLTLAVARGQAPAVSDVVICSGFGLQVIHLDAEGNPVGAPHICPDGVAAFVSLDVPQPVVPAQELEPGERLPIAQQRAQSDLSRTRAVARGPPGIA